MEVWSVSSVHHLIPLSTGLWTIKLLSSIIEAFDKMPPALLWLPGLYWVHNRLVCIGSLLQPLISWWGSGHSYHVCHQARCFKVRMIKSIRGVCRICIGGFPKLWECVRAKRAQKFYNQYGTWVTASLSWLTVRIHWWPALQRQTLLS